MRYGDEAVTCPACCENYPDADSLVIDPVTQEYVCYDCTGQWAPCAHCTGQYLKTDLYPCGGCHDCLYPSAVLQLPLPLEMQQTA